MTVCLKGASLVAVVGLSLIVPPSASLAEDRGAWFKSLRQPDTGLSCCDIADCRRTDAEWKAGQWFARIEGEMTPIPKKKELTKTSIDGDAYVCSGYNRKIYCFIPPTLAM